MNFAQNDFYCNNLKPNYYGCSNCNYNCSHKTSNDCPPYLPCYNFPNNIPCHRCNDRWSQIPYPGQTEPYEGLEKNAGNWPLYFLKLHCDGTFTTLCNNKVHWNMKNPCNIDFQTELTEVEKVQENLTPCQTGIAKFWGTGVPVEQWTPIALKLIDTYKVSPPMSARILSILQNAISDGFTVCWYYKFYGDFARPVQLNPDFKPLLNTPKFPTYPSGHSVVSGVACIVLSYFFPAESKKLHELAETASLSRLYGGIHFRSDLTNGIAVGKQLGAIVIDCISHDVNGCGHPIDTPYTKFLDAPIMPTYC